MTETGVMTIRRAPPIVRYPLLKSSIYVSYRGTFVFGGVVPVVSRLFHV